MARIKTPIDGLRDTAMARDVENQLKGLGEFIGSQRKAAELSLRQLAERAGVSNPYLSQIERGLRKPSADVLQALARALQVSAEQLYVRAGILDPEEHDTVDVETAILADPVLTQRQKQTLLDVYASFVGAAEPEPDQPAEPAATNKASAAKATKKTSTTTAKKTAKKASTTKRATTSTSH